MPPRVNDRTTPEQSYRTFRGAIARKEYDREWACLSDRLQERLGLRNRGEWIDARVVVLDDGHLLIKGIIRSDIEGEPETLADGRVLLRLKFPFGHRGRVFLSRANVLRIFVRGDPSPRIYEQLEALELRFTTDSLSLALDPRMVRNWFEFEALGPDDQIERVEAGVEWFLDDFATGDENPESVRATMDERRDK